MEKERISFNKTDKCAFTTALKERVGLYFKDKDLSQKSTFSMKAKSIFLMSLVVIIYAAFLVTPAGIGGMFGFYILLGLGMAIGTMNIAHDAMHGAYVPASWKNRALGLVMDLAGACSFYWKKEHVVDHHTFTNIIEHDADLDVPILLRLCPHAPYRSFHRFQHWYAPFLYSLNILRWVYVSDMKRIFRILKDRKTAPGKPSVLETVLMILFKVIHLSIFLIVPMIVLPFAWWQVGLGYLVFLGTIGFTVTVIFQLAHIVENVAFPEPNQEGYVNNSFIKHQIATTSNFGMKSRLVAFLFGGLNFQVEHHLFPNLCHIHLSEIAPIVQATAKEFGVPYYSNRTLFSAIRSHFATLKRLGRGV